MTRSATGTGRILAVLLACAPALAAAQGGQPRDMSFEQFRQRLAGRIMAADSDGNGRVTQAEFTAAMSKGKGDPAARFARMDMKRDGVIDATEIDAMAKRRFDRLDTNGDGTLTAQERAAARQKAGDGEP